MRAPDACMPRAWMARCDGNHNGAKAVLDERGRSAVVLSAQFHGMAACMQVVGSMLEISTKNNHTGGVRAQVSSATKTAVSFLYVLVSADSLASDLPRLGAKGACV